MLRPNPLKCDSLQQCDANSQQYILYIIKTAVLTEKVLAGGMYSRLSFDQRFMYPESMRRQTARKCDAL